jgi:hypothetical protein
VDKLCNPSERGWQPAALPLHLIALALAVVLTREELVRNALFAVRRP